MTNNHIKVFVMPSKEAKQALENGKQCLYDDTGCESIQAQLLR